MTAFSVCNNCHKVIALPLENCFCWWRERAREFIEEDSEAGMDALRFIDWLEKRTKEELGK